MSVPKPGTFAVPVSKSSPVASDRSRMHVELVILVALPHGTPAGMQPGCMTWQAHGDAGQQLDIQYPVSI